MIFVIENFTESLPFKCSQPCMDDFTNCWYSFQKFLDFLLKKNIQHIFHLFCCFLPHNYPIVRQYWVTDILLSVISPFLQWLSWPTELLSICMCLISLILLAYIWIY